MLNTHGVHPEWHGKFPLFQTLDVLDLCRLEASGERITVVRIYSRDPARRGFYIP